MNDTRLACVERPTRHCSATKLLSLACALSSWPGTRGNHDCAIACSMHSCGYSKYIVPCTLLAVYIIVIPAVGSLPYHANLANKLSIPEDFAQ